MNWNPDWKWILIGVGIMVLLNLAGALLLGLVLGPEIRAAASPNDINLSSAQIALALAINVLAFLIGGFIVGLKSAGRTILEPGVSALIAVILALIISQQFTVANLIVGGFVPFVAGVFGGWLGERRQSAA